VTKDLGYPHGVHERGFALEAVSGLLAHLIQEVKERNAKDEDLQHLLKS
jgi:hypothetical protein